MRSAISKQAIQYQDPSFKVDTSENHAVFYSFVSTPPSQDNIYSFREGDLTLSTKGENNTIVLTWDTLLDKSIIEGYRLYRGTYSNGEDLKPINTTIIKDLRYIDKDVNFGTNYYYLCSVVYKNGNEFIISNEAMGVTVK